MADARQLLHRETKTDGPFQKTVEIYAPDAPKPTPPEARLTDSQREYMQEQVRRAAQQNLYTQQETYPEFMQRRAQEAAVRADMAREAKTELQDPLAYAARQDGPHSAMLGSLAGDALGYGMAQQVHAPGKTFSRVEILAVLRSRKAILVGRPHFEEACRELDTLIDVFERMQ